MPKPIYHIDASQLKNSDCFRRFYLTVVKGYTSPQFDIKMFYGTCFHKFLELYHTGTPGTIAKGVALSKYEIPSVIDLTSDNYKEFRTPAHLSRSIDAYIEQYPYIDDGIVPLTNPNTGKKIAEQTFSVPFYEDENFAVCISGIIDLPCKYHGQLSIVDHKTTSTTDKPFKYFNQYKRSIQTKLYTWIDKVYNKRDYYIPVVINGIFLKTWTIKAKEKNTFDGASFERSSPFEYEAWEMEEFETWLEYKLADIVNTLKQDRDVITDNGSVNLTKCIEFPKLCPYFSVCSAPPEFRKSSLADSFSVREYNPATFHE